MSLLEPQKVADLMFQANSASLATLDHQSQAPYASLVNINVDSFGPVLLISELAWHTKNIRQNSNGSLLFVANEPNDLSSDPLQALRATVLGTFQEVGDDHSRTVYLERHPEAKMYADFTDFSFWRLKPKTVHAIAGFGAIATYNADQVFDAVQS